jgi:cob(I)alamin adenosyltransferase
MKIYTKKGDQGSTSLIGGDRVLKSHDRIEAYGTIDELNSHIGILRSFVNDDINPFILKELQDRLFTIGSILASAPDSKMVVPDLHAADTEMLENAIDKMNEELPVLRTFILPAGSMHIAQCHVVRCVCRRAERLVVNLNEMEPIDELILQYLNRLSDYLFVLARYIAFKSNIEEVSWLPRK